MKVRIAVPVWIARELEPFVGTRVRLSKVANRPDASIELMIGDKALAHPPNGIDPDDPRRVDGDYDGMRADREEP